MSDVQQQQTNVPLTIAAISGAGLLALAVFAGLSQHQLTAGPAAAVGHVQVFLDGGNPAGVVKVWGKALVAPSAQAVFGYDAGGASVYVRVALCAVPVDGGVDPGPSFLPGVDIEYNDTAQGVCDGGDPALEAWVDGWREVDGGYPPWPCACAPVDAGAACQWQQPIRDDGGTLAVTAPLGFTMDPGTWSGACRPMICTLISGARSWPPECGAFP